MQVQLNIECVVKCYPEVEGAHKNKKNEIASKIHSYIGYWEDSHSYLFKIRLDL